MGVPVDRPALVGTTAALAAFLAGLGSGLWKDAAALAARRPGALVLGAETGTTATAPRATPGHVSGVVSFRSAAVTALLLNVGYHPARLSIGPSLRPYVSVGVGPYVGTGG